MVGFEPIQQNSTGFFHHAILYGCSRPPPQYFQGCIIYVTSEYISLKLTKHFFYLVGPEISWNIPTLFLKHIYERGRKNPSPSPRWAIWPIENIQKEIVHSWTFTLTLTLKIAYYMKHWNSRFSNYYREWNENENTKDLWPASNYWWPDSILDFAYTSANHKSEPKLGECVSQSAGRIRMMCHQISKPCETLPCSQDFHDKLIAP